MLSKNEISTAIDFFVLGTRQERKISDIVFSHRKQYYKRIALHGIGNGKAINTVKVEQCHQPLSVREGWQKVSVMFMF